MKKYCPALICNKCKTNMRRWLKDPVSKDWIWKCPHCGETERDKE